MEGQILSRIKRLLRSHKPQNRLIMSQGKVKIYKNPNRNDAPTYKSYVPQYQVLGVEPTEYKSHQVPAGTTVAQNSNDNPRVKNAGMRQNIDSENKKLSIPNVGNNIEQIWSGVDNQIVDDLEEVDLNQPMIDNNDYVTDSALGLPSSQTSSQPSLEQKDKDIKYGDELVNVVQDLSEGQYLLLVNGVPVCHGDLVNVQEQATDLIFGDHPLCDGNPTPVDSLMILKKCKVKLGLFLE